MSKIFNVNGDCRPEIHYMVDISSRLNEIKKMVDKGQYFTINRARQYGKTTTLKALKKLLENHYLVIWMDFQLLSHASFETEQRFVIAFSKELLRYCPLIPGNITKQLETFAGNRAGDVTLQDLFLTLSQWCRISEKKIVFMIDEVDSATNNQVFLDFLSQLRGYYLNRDISPTFQSVILAGVYDVKNIKRKIRPEENYRINSPWNIAADFDVAMSLSENGIKGMLREYENDCHTGMNQNEIAGLLYDYTSGYPYLVSRICKLIDEKIAGSSSFPDKMVAWTKQGFLEAVRILISKNNTLFESLLGKLMDYPSLRQTLYSLLFAGEVIAYNVLDQSVNDAIMFGFVKKQDSNIVVANRIFEVLLYNYFLTSADAQNAGNRTLVEAVV